MLIYFISVIYPTSKTNKKNFASKIAQKGKNEDYFFSSFKVTLAFQKVKLTSIIVMKIEKTVKRSRAEKEKLQNVLVTVCICQFQAIVIDDKKHHGESKHLD